MIGEEATPEAPPFLGPRNGRSGRKPSRDDLVDASGERLGEALFLQQGVEACLQGPHVRIAGKDHLITLGSDEVDHAGEL